MNTTNTGLAQTNAALEAANDDLQNLIESTAIATLFLDTASRLRRYTPAATDLFALGADSIGKPVHELQQRVEYPQLAADVETARQRQEPVEREIEASTDGKAYEVRANPYTTSTGEVAGVVLTFIDVTDRNRRATVQARLASIIDSTQDGIFGQDLDGHITSWNPGSERLTGYSEDEAIGSTVSLFLPPDQLADVLRIFERTFQGESVANHETQCKRKDGAICPIAITASPVRSSGDRITGISVIAQGIAARLEVERQRDVLMDELDHRVKNTLVAVQSIARQTAKGTDSIDTFLERFDSRLSALSRTHDLLLERHWTGAPLQNIVSSELLPYSDVAAQYTAEGPDVQVSPKQALALGLAFHELATNAAKHGAFSTAAGRVDVSWHVKNEADGPILHLVWLERGGPSVTPPKSRGFGSRLIERGLRSELQAEAILHFEPKGVRFELIAPLTAEAK